VIQQGFKNSGDLIALFGTTYDDLSVSAYAEIIEGNSTADMIAQGFVPRLNLEREKAVHNAVIAAAEVGLLHSAHDCVRFLRAQNCRTHLVQIYLDNSSSHLQPGRPGRTCTPPTQRGGGISASAVSWNRARRCWYGARMDPPECAIACAAVRGEGSKRYIFSAFLHVLCSPTAVRPFPCTGNGRTGA